MPSGFVTVSAAHLTDTVGNPVNGTIHFQPVLNMWGIPIAYQKPDGGQASNAPVSAAVVDGAFSITLPDVTACVPANIMFAVSVIDGTTKASLLGPGYNMCQPHTVALNTDDWCQDGVCNFDNFVPNLEELVLVQYGPQGIQGIPGPTGPQGIQGTTGSQGIQGAKGDKGDTGDTGPTGSQGIQGDKGDKGDTGSQGIQGVKGDTGDTGPTGSQGIQGAKGDKGDTGAQGIQGPAGVPPAGTCTITEATALAIALG